MSLLRLLKNHYTEDETTSWTRDAVRMTHGDEPLSGQELSILIISEDPAYSDLAHTLLGYHGFNVLGATNGPDGVLIAETQQPSLVLLHWAVGPPNWHEVAEQLHRNEVTCHIPIILAGYRTPTRPADKALRKLNIVHIIPAVPSDLKDDLLEPINRVLGTKGSSGPHDFIAGRCRIAHFSTILRRLLEFVRRIIRVD